MTLQEAQTIVREAAIKANPAIMEFTFGCEIQHPSSALEKGILIESEDNESRESWRIFFPEMNQDLVTSLGSRIRGNSWHKPATPNYKILGRPIRLADVLLAIAKNSGRQPYVCLHDAGLEIGNGHFWNLLKDDLRDQSPETLAFLAELLK